MAATLEKMKKEMQETPAEEAAETPKEEAKEQEEGLEGHSGEGVDVSEEYQQHAHSITHKASKHELHHLQRKIDDRHQQLREEERKKEAKNAPKHMKNVPEMYSSTDMPMD